MKISIVLLNYGYQEFVFECLRSIERIRRRDCCELIFVDNGSSHEEWSRINTKLHELPYRIDKCLHLNSNQGFAAGMNAGSEVARGDWIVLLNNDTLLGERFLEQILAAIENVKAAQIGFLALPIYDWDYSGAHSVPTTNWQADVAALTSYGSCMPVRCSGIKPHFVLGPAGPVVIISANLVQALKESYGCLYDPHFFMYGEDVDLFLRAKRLGFDTHFIQGSVDRGEVIWHIGSGTSRGQAASMKSLHKDPAIVRRILDGMYDNVITHAGWIELGPLILVHSIFRAIFYFCYALENSPTALWRLLLMPREKRPKPVARDHSRPLGLWLSKYIALGRRTPMPWAKANG